MKRGLLIDYLDRFELLLDEEESVYASTEKLKGVKSLSFDNCSEVFGERVDDYVRYKSVNIKEETETSVVVENEEFFVDYDAIKCNCREFDLLKHRLHEDGWKWFNGHNRPKQSLLNETPNHLALI